MILLDYIFILQLKKINLEKLKKLKKTVYIVL
jgi:hypothetical protein